jgi:hypothetical protein
VAYPEVFAAGAIIAGLPYGSAATVQAAFEVMAQGSDRSREAWGDLVRSASPHRGSWPRLSVWHGSADPIVNPRNAEEIVKQWTNVHGLAAAPDFVHQVRGHSRRVWRDATGADVIESYIISGMGHGVPLALGHGSDDCGHAGAYHFDVGLPSSLQIAKFFGIASDRPKMVDDVTDALVPVPETPAVSNMPVIAAQTLVAEPIAQRFDHSAGTGEGSSNAHGNPLDPRDVITAALQKVGLLVPPGSKPTGDARSIISSTLRSVGLLKE